MVGAVAAKAECGWMNNNHRRPMTIDWSQWNSRLCTVYHWTCISGWCIIIVQFYNEETPFPASFNFRYHQIRSLRFSNSLKLA